MIKCIVFDMDGTLVDTLIDLQVSVNYILSKYNYPTRTYDEIRSFVGNGLDLLLKRALPENGKDKFDSLYPEFLEYYGNHAMDNIMPYEGIKEMLESLKSQGLLIACVTNKIDNVAKEIVNRYFNGLIDITCGMQKSFNKKPAPDMCNYVLEELGVSKENAIYVGDSEVDYQTAVNSNLKCISCTWGFRSKELLEEIGSTNIIDTPNELFIYIK